MVSAPMGWQQANISCIMMPKLYRSHAAESRAAHMVVVVSM
jgi:hypothetical protein